LVSCGRSEELTTFSNSKIPYLQMVALFTGDEPSFHAILFKERIKQRPEFR
jgi:hypothetical protein